jgi:hypothetical protein
MKECLIYKTFFHSFNDIIISLILKVQWHEIFQDRSKDRVKTKCLQYNCRVIYLYSIFVHE